MWCATCEEAGDKISYLGLRADTLNKHENGQPWAHGCKLRKEQQRLHQQQKQEVTGHVRDGLSKPCAG
jgi:hypothetical protein